MNRPNVPEHYPHQEWNRKRQEYNDYWRHFNGDWLDEKVGDSGQLEYPLKLNPFSLPCLLHAGFLFGEVGDGDSPLTKTVIEPWNRDAKDQKRDEATRMTDTVNRVWTENAGRSLQQEAGIISQVYGGCVFGTAYDLDLQEEGRLPIRIDHVLPDYFYPVPAHNQYWRLLEAIIAYEITGLQAASYGVQIPEDQPKALYQEHWGRDSYEITVNGEYATWQEHTLEGKPVGISPPYTYIPHIRIGSFYGESLLKNKLALAKEINNRFADVGDIVNMNARMLPFLVNAQKVTLRELGGGVVVLDGGRAIPGMDAPSLEYPRSSSQVSKPTIDWALELLSKARTEVYTPPVLYGIDEGSQRSSLTLALRALPVMVHIKQERTFFTSGLNQVARNILSIAAAKGVNGITQEMLRDIRIYQEWAPIMPRDQDQLVNEMILRLNAGLIDPKTAMEKIGDIRDTDTVLNLVKEWMEYTSELNSQGMENPFGGAGSGGEQAQANRPNAPKPSISKTDKGE